MPIREYECPVCGYCEEHIEFVLRNNPPLCRRCQEEVDKDVEMKRRISTTNFALSDTGVGWARNGYAGSGELKRLGRKQ